MSLLGKIKKISHRETGIRDFCIETIRFKKFLENARVLLDLFADGREKVLGEYIFDRHYVVTLIDGVVDRLGMMVFDAVVLAPESGEGLYAAYDRHKLAARNLIEKGTAGTGAAADDGTDPEFRLLSEVLKWCEGAGPADGTSVLAFMRRTFFQVIQRLESNAAKERKKNALEKAGIPAAGMGIYVVDLWKDAVETPAKNRSVRDFASIPFRRLLVDAGQGNAETPGLPSGNGAARWVAAVSEYQLSLSALRPDARLRLETLASGHESSDFIFIFADSQALLDKILPDGFHVERADDGQFAWSLDMRAKTIEDALMIIGRNLFAESGRPVARPMQ